MTLSFVNGKWYNGELDENGDLVTGAAIVSKLEAWARSGLCNTGKVEPVSGLAKEVHSIGVKYAEQNGHSPTARDLASLAKASLTTVFRAIAELEAIGLVSRRPGEARNLQFLK